MPPTSPAGLTAGVATPMRPAHRLKWAAGGWIAGFVASQAALTAVSLIVAGPGGFTSGDLTIGWITLLQVPLWAGLLGAPVLARRHGLRWRPQLGWSMRPLDVPVGIGCGLGLQFALVPLLYAPIFRVFGDLDASDVERAARELTDRVDGPFDVVSLALMTLVMAPLAEEVFFRGLLQGALQERIGPAAGVAAASAAFAASHFQPLQFPALVLVGAVHGLLVWRTGRLGAALWSHFAFNSVTLLSLLALT